MLVNERKSLYNLFAIHICTVFNRDTIDHFKTFAYPFILDGFCF